jgi:hypothetical protein
VQADWKAQNVRMVAVWNRVYARPPRETFHEFLIEVPLKGTFGEPWYKAEISKPENERHVVEQWLRSFREVIRKNTPKDGEPGRAHSAPATGTLTELLALAHDLYMLQKVDRLPEKLINRLRNYKEFQGARYEVAIAAAFVKCGFEIRWINDRSGPHPEFVAVNARTGEEVSVETKSRRRPGALHQAGTLPPAEELRADVERLYREALKQDPRNRTFAVFLDVNLPGSTAAGEAARWQREVFDDWKDKAQQIGLLGFTNFAWHYRGNELATGPEFILSVPTATEHPLRTPETLFCLQRALNAYGVVPSEY